MRQVTPPPVRPRDPAPSRVAYRMHRLWLTPMFRKMLRVGLPFLICFAATLWFLQSEQRRAAIVATYEDTRRAIEQRPEFMVNLMSVEGASPDLAGDIHTLVPVDFPISSFDMDLPAIRALIETLDPVAAAHLHIRPGGVLQVRIEERQAIVVWRSPTGLLSLDETGHPIHTLTLRTDRADLPLIAGDGADDAVPEALALIAAAEPLADRMRGLRRKGARRWDIALDRGQLIQLPETDPVPVLERLIALDKAQDMLARDITHIDLRNPRRPTLRLAGTAVEAMRRIKSIEAGEPQE
ncbi:cell division protein FtsQ/DivIB [Actibacterium sp. 188UL27-1]|uniref:cell division protein FtsQ/DivIB n=1 Tax=Actibacterium sp. 188UL27-1 TaxID=2786961 RepID=UPI00195681FE|nr:cell division protein FtsQ/DivIB [Actibacterium sp. 188UL27-1]MBM7068906.1 cell division protein FtsQ/DivIB [Actibacterium sp. 188UL27-1]